MIQDWEPLRFLRADIVWGTQCQLLGQAQNLRVGLKARSFREVLSSQDRRHRTNSTKPAEKFQQALRADLPTRGTSDQPVLIKDFQEKLTIRKRKTFRTMATACEKAMWPDIAMGGRDPWKWLALREGKEPEAIWHEMKVVAGVGARPCLTPRPY